MIIILTGAGISAESGLRTWRADTGLWEQSKVDDICTMDGFRRDHRAVQAFYDARHADITAAAPNAAHHALARLEAARPGEVLIITQNIDDLHERAGSKSVLHIHGTAASAICADCGISYPAHAGQLAGSPPCGLCGGNLRPDITFFGETPKHLPEIQRRMQSVSTYIAIGTSGEVEPAASLVKIAKKRHAKRLEFNLARTPKSNWFREWRRGPASESVPRFVEEHLSSTA